MLTQAASRVGLVVVLLVAACTSAPRPAPSPADVPDLRGTWTGAWGGTPLRLVVLDQQAAGGVSGVYLGSLLVVGHQQPTVSGVLTFVNRGEAVSVSAQGWLQSSRRGLTLAVDAAPPDGKLQLTLTRVAPERLTGSGTSSFRWGPQGPVELTRAGAAPVR